MVYIVITALFLTVLMLLVIQPVTIRINWQKKLVFSFDYMFFTFFYTVKSSKKRKKKKYFASYILKFIKRTLPYSSVTLHKALISFSCDDYAQAYITDGAIRSVLFPTLSAIRALSKDFNIDSGAIETQCLNDEIPSPHFDISVKLKLFHVLLSLFSFSKIYLRKKAKEAK